MDTANTEELSEAERRRNAYKRVYRPAYNRASALMMLACLACAGWMVFSFYEVTTRRRESLLLRNESAQLDNEIRIKKQESEKLEKQLADKQRLIETIAPLLDLTPLVTSDPAKAARSATTVQYVSRDIKPESLAVIKQFGFSVEDKRASDGTPTTNIIWFGKNVSIGDVKLVAYILVKNGFGVNDVKLFTRASALDNVIQVGALGKSKSKSHLTIEQIALKKSFVDADISWLSGVWEGEATQIVAGGSGAPAAETGHWTIRLTVQKGKYTVDYPSVSCGGKWTLLEKGAKTLKFKEKLTYGDRCVDNGYAVIEKKDASRILFNYVNPDGTGVTSFGILTKIDN
jgi:hypothetical protein